MTGTVTVTRLDVPRAALGEGPVWDVADARLYYVDAAGGELRAFDPVTGAHESWSFGERVGCLARRERGGFLLARQSGFHVFDPATGEHRALVDPDPDPATSLNDGKADAAGRYVCGSVDLEMKDARGHLYRLDPDGSCTVLDDGLTVSNGPCWSPDGRTLYHADSVPKTIYAFDYDPATGSATNRRVFASTAALGGIPDGATVDADGYLWTAVCEGGVVARFAPDGSLDRTIAIPVSLPSSVMFGGEGLDRLFVTTIDPPTFGFPAEPDGGSTYVIDGLGVRGLPEHRFAG